MKKQFLLLPLVAILAACNKGSGNNDIFTKARGRKVDAETKQSVMNRYNLFGSLLRYTFASCNYIKEGREWVPMEEEDISTSHYMTECSLTSEYPYCVLKEIYNYNTDAESAYTQFEIQPNEQTGKPEFVNGENEGGWYDKSAAETWKLVSGSVYSWNTSIFCGMTEFLVSMAGKAYMPQAALNKFANKFEIVQDGDEGDFFISKKDECVYKQGTVEYRIDEFLCVYEDYRLRGYTNSITLSVEMKDGNDKIKTEMSFRTQIEDIGYYNAG